MNIERDPGNKRRFVFVIALPALLAGCALVQSTYPDLDTEVVVKKVFWDHEAQFNQLRSMMTEEQKICSVKKSCGWYVDSKGHRVRIDWDYSAVKKLSEASISPDRVERYHKLMKMTDVTSLFKDSKTGVVDMWIGELPKTRHICYSPHGSPPDYRLVQDTSGLSHVCCEISPDWYFLREEAYENDD